MGAELHAGIIRSASMDTVREDDAGYTPAASTPPSPPLAPSMGAGLHAGSLRSALVGVVVRRSEDDAGLHAGSLHAAIAVIGNVHGHRAARRQPRADVVVDFGKCRGTTPS
jgi:hypothetical protein